MNRRDFLKRIVQVAVAAPVAIATYPILSAEEVEATIPEAEAAVPPMQEATPLKMSGTERVRWEYWTDGRSNYGTMPTPGTLLLFNAPFGPYGYCGT